MNDLPKAIELAPDRSLLPKKLGNRFTRYFKCTSTTLAQGHKSLIQSPSVGFFTTYRSLFSLIFITNLVTLIGLSIKNNGLPSQNDVGTASSVNLTIALLFRQEDFINLCYEIICSTPHSFPLSIRRRLAKLFHYGGIHSGAGTASCLWFFLYLGLITRDWIQNRSNSNFVNFVLCYVVALMFITILVVAHPRFRRLLHDYFEAGHRFSGWISLITFWIYMGLAGHENATAEGIPLGTYFAQSPNFWCFIISTSVVLLSWSRLRPREVYPEFLSDRVIRLHFKHKNIRPFYGHRFSTSPLFEWHGFATIPDRDEHGKPQGFSIIVSKAGDWTSSVIANPPKRLWTRGYPTHDLLTTSRLFDRVVVVATGSGIAPCLSMFQANIHASRRIIWSTPDPEKTYGPKIMSAVLEADPDAVVWDTRVLGRPDMVALTYDLVVQSKAEAVYIVSNAKVSKDVVYAMETRGIPAYGPIFDH